MTIVKTITLIGLEGVVIDVEADVSNGFPGWEIVGLADTTVKESKERIKTAIKNVYGNLLSKKYVINLSPAGIKKEGSVLDLPIAVAILIELGVIKRKNLHDTIIIGELSLNGDIKPVNGVFASCLEAKNKNFKNIIIPESNSDDVRLISGINIITARNLNQLVETINIGKMEFVRHEKKNVDSHYEFVFENIYGHKEAKRGLEIASAGMHNCIMVGAQGVGKTVPARSVPSIMPDLTFEEMLEIKKIYSIYGNNNSLCNRPFRNPHHTITQMALIGGGSSPKFGEITLAHNGVLFLDELTEFKSSILEMLREPIEEGKITINRKNISLTFPCRFMLLAAMNPCPCGYYGSKIKKCTCSETQLERYRHKISGPFLDRIDIHIDVKNQAYQAIEKKKEMTSYEIREKINKCHSIQKERYKNENMRFNSQLSPDKIAKYCILNQESKQILQNLLNKQIITTRGYYKIIKVARTIADLEEENAISLENILEAIYYKNIK